MEAFLGEIRPFAISYPPRDWMQCNGQTLAVAQYRPLFTVIGILYGGDGTTTFALPNLQGTVLVGSGPQPGGDQYNVGNRGGEPGIPLQITEIPAHTHTFNGLVTTDEDSAPAKGFSIPDATCFLSNVYEVPPPTTKRKGNFYTTDAPGDSLNPQAISIAGGSQPHSNMQPYLAINYFICVNGHFPVKP
ncbi:MAG: tail fiber protein [Chitinophagaceae bacterium]